MTTTSNNVRQSIDLGDQTGDIHIYVIPHHLWSPQLNTTFQDCFKDTVSAGIVRILLESDLTEFRKTIERELGLNLLPQNYVFCKNVGHSIGRIRPEQERLFKVKEFVPPQCEFSEIYIIDQKALDSTKDIEHEIKHAPNNIKPIVVDDTHNHRVRQFLEEKRKESLNRIKSASSQYSQLGNTEEAPHRLSQQYHEQLEKHRNSMQQQNYTEIPQILVQQENTLNDRRNSVQQHNQLEKDRTSVYQPNQVENRRVSVNQQNETLEHRKSMEQPNRIEDRRVSVNQQNEPEEHRTSIYQSNQIDDRRVSVNQQNETLEHRKSIEQPNQIEDRRVSVNQQNKPEEHRTSIYQSNQIDDRRVSVNQQNESLEYRKSMEQPNQMKNGFDLMQQQNPVKDHNEPNLEQQSNQIENNRGSMQQQNDYYQKPQSSDGSGTNPQLNKENVQSRYPSAKQQSANIFQPFANNEQHKSDNLTYNHNESTVKMTDNQDFKKSQPDFSTMPSNNHSSEHLNTTNLDAIYRKSVNNGSPAIPEFRPYVPTQILSGDAGLDSITNAIGHQKEILQRLEYEQQLRIAQLQAEAEERRRREAEEYARELAKNENHAKRMEELEKEMHRCADESRILGERVEQANQAWQSALDSKQNEIIMLKEYLEQMKEERNKTSNQPTAKELASEAEINRLQDKLREMQERYGQVKDELEDRRKAADARMKAVNDEMNKMKRKMSEIHQSIKDVKPVEIPPPVVKVVKEVAVEADFVIPQPVTQPEVSKHTIKKKAPQYLPIIPIDGDYNKLAYLRKLRIAAEKRRIELIKKLHALYVTLATRRTQIRDEWKRKYYSAKKQASALELRMNAHRENLEMLVRRSTKTLKHSGSDSPGAIALAHLIDKRREVTNEEYNLAAIMFNLTKAIKLRTQAENECRLLNSELDRRRGELSLVKSTSPSRRIYAYSFSPNRQVLGVHSQSSHGNKKSSKYSRPSRMDNPLVDRRRSKPQINLTKRSQLDRASTSSFTSTTQEVGEEMAPLPNDNDDRTDEDRTSQSIGKDLSEADQPNGEPKVTFSTGPSLKEIEPLTT